jgi:hypothetical protein
LEKVEKSFEFIETEFDKLPMAVDECEIVGAHPIKD